MIFTTVLFAVPIILKESIPNTVIDVISIENRLMKVAMILNESIPNTVIDVISIKNRLMEVSASEEEVDNVVYEQLESLLDKTRVQMAMI